MEHLTFKLQNTIVLDWPAEEELPEVGAVFQVGWFGVFQVISTMVSCGMPRRKRVGMRFHPQITPLLVRELSSQRS